jgi:hypothetical protein
MILWIAPTFAHLKDTTMTNTLVENEFWLLDLTYRLRHAMLDWLTDADLSFTLPGSPTLGALCRESVASERAYLESFRNFALPDFNPETDPHTETSVAALAAAWNAQEQAMRDVLSALPQDVVQTQTIDRGGGFTPSLSLNFQFYRESLLIFAARASLYLKALGKPLNHQWLDWIG